MPMWAQHYGVPFQPNPFFPVNTLALMRGAAAADRSTALFERYHPAIYKAMWVDGAQPQRHERSRRRADRRRPRCRGSSANRIQDQDVKDRLKTTTDDAVARGVFGAPTCFVDSMMFFGNDRLPFVEMALNGELK